MTDLLQQAKQALAAGQSTQALQLCNDALRHQPGHKPTRAFMARLHLDKVNILLRQPQLRLADLRCRMALEVEPQNREAHRLLAEIAWLSGLPGHALPHLKKAGDKRAYLTALQQLKQLPEAVRMAPAPLPDSPPRYLLIKAWPAGFFSCLSQVVGQLLIAELTGRVPGVYWGEIGLFSNGNNDSFTRFFEPLSKMDAAGLEPLANDIFPPKWRADNLLQDNINLWQGEGSRLGPIDLLSRPETVLVSDFFCWMTEILPWIPTDHRLYGRGVFEVQAELAQRYFKAAPALIEQTEAFCREAFSSPFIAVHLRGSDKSGEHPIMATLNNQYQPRIDAMLAQHPDHQLFLLTDSETELARMQQRYGDRLVTRNHRRTAGNTGLHFLKSDDKVGLGREVMLDVLTAIRADAFIGTSHSNVSRFIAQYREWAPTQIDLLGNFDSDQLDGPLMALTRQP